MARLLSCLPLVLIASFACAVPATTEGPLSRLLMPEEFSRAGLAKLSPAELGALESALAAHGALPRASKQVPETMAPAESGRPEARPTVVSREAGRGFGEEQVVRLKAADTANELRAHIDGTVQEINGRAVVALDNGQVWQQRSPDRFYFAHKLVNPEIVITRGVGGYKMVIVPTNCVLFVKRIQ